MTTPAEQGFDPMLLAELYFNAAKLETLYGLLVIKNGYLSNVDQKMMDFFPEFVGQITDLRKNQITIRDMLQMRAGYPLE